MEIEKNCIKGKLPNTQGNLQKNYDMKREPFTQNDMKALYRLWAEDNIYLASLVEAKEIFVKSSKATKGDKVAKMPSLQVARMREWLIRVIKNELMNQFGN